MPFAPAIQPTPARRNRPLSRHIRPFLQCTAALLVLMATAATAATAGTAAAPGAAFRHDGGTAASGAPAPGPAADLAPTVEVTPTEGLAVMRAIAPLRETYPGCGQEVELSGTSASFTCNAAAGHFFRVAVEGFPDETAALTRFEALREGHPVVPFHEYASAAWELAERPNAMRHRNMIWQAQRWVFTAVAFDDTIYNIAADPREMSERLHEAAQAVGLLPAAAPVGGWDVQHLDDRAGAVSAVAVDGETAYVGVGQSLEILDLADPAGPRSIGSRTLHGLARDIVLHQSVAFVAEGDEGFETIDVSDPAYPEPRELASIPTRGMALSGDVLVVVGGSGEETGLRIVAAEAANLYEPLSFLPTPGDALAVATVAGRSAFVADGDAGLRIVDISDPRRAREVAALPMEALGVAVSASGTYVYVAAGDGGMAVVDASDPSAPFLAAVFTTGRGPTLAVESSGQTAYASIAHGDLVVVDVSTPAAPVARGIHAASRPIHGCGGVTYGNAELAAQLAIADGRAYVAAWENGLRVLDVSAPGAPSEIGWYASPFTCAMDVQLRGDRAYVAADRDGLRVLAWRGGRRLQELGAVTGITATMLSVSDDYVYAADNHGLWIIDVRDPAAPTIAASMNPFGRWIDDLAYRDGFLYVAAAGMEGRLMVVDVRDPAAPRLAGEYPSDHPLWSVALSGHHAFVVDGSRLEVIDVTEPSSPARVGRLALPPGDFALQLAGQMLYLANSDGMIHFVDIAEPTSPRLVGAHRAPVLATMAVSDDMAILSGDSETMLLSLAHPTDPTSRLPFTDATSVRASGIAVDGHELLFARGARGLLLEWIGPFTLPSAVEQRPEFVGQIGGGYEAVAFDGDLAYAAIGERLVVLDATEPAAPVRLGTTPPFPDVVYDLALRGRYAILAAGRAGLRVVDVTTPTAPREIASLPWPSAAREVVVAGDIAYVADVSAGLAMVDVAEPTAPRLLNTISDGGARSVAVGDGYAYVLADGLSEVQVYDVRIPAAPRRVGTEMFLGGGSRLALAGHHVFVAALDSGLLVLDVADPAAPLRSGWLECRALDVAVWNDRAYVLGEDWLHVVDLSPPSEPRLLGSWRTPGAAATVALDAAGHAVVADLAAGLRVVDVGDAAKPRELGAYRDVGLAHNVFGQGQVAYVAARAGGLDIISVAWPSHPVPLGHLDVMATDVVVAGDYAYVAGASDLQVIDVREPSAPRPIDSVSYSGEATDLDLSGGLAFVTAGEAGLAIVDVVDLNAVHVAGAIDTPGEARGVAVNGATAYVADGPAGLRVIDVSDPASPREVGAAAELVGATGVIVVGDHAYVSTQLLDPEVSSVWAVDVSDPRRPRAVGALGTWGSPAGLYASGNAVFVATGVMGVSALDMGDPTRPGEFLRYGVPGLPRGVFVLDRQVLVAADEGGLYLFERGLPRPLVKAALYLPAATR